MKCATVRDELSRYVEGESPGRLQAAIAQHLAVCSACRAEAEGHRRAEEALRSLAAVVPAPDLGADLRRRLSAVGSRPRPLRWLWAGTALAAVATAALLALRVPVPVSPPQTVVRGSARAEDHPPQLAAGPVTEEGGVHRPTAPPAPTPAASHRTTASPHHTSRLQHDAPPAASREDVVQEAEEGEAGTVTTPRLVDSSTPRPDGVVLLVAAPEPPRPSSSYYGQVTLPDGAVSTYQETVERNAAGESQSVKIAYQETPPPAGAGNGG